MDKIGKISLLLDFYGPLLTEKQLEYMSLYYHHDLSLSEIAEEKGVSRQAVFDLVKRGEKVLCEYEEKLGLVQKFLQEREILSKVAAIINRCSSNTDQHQLAEAVHLLSEVLELESN